MMNVSVLLVVFVNGGLFFEGPVCRKYSLNNNGPCINGGKLICKGEEVATKMTCQCPPHYSGAFCENKVENVCVCVCVCVCVYMCVCVYIYICIYIYI